MPHDGDGGYGADGPGKLDPKHQPPRKGSEFSSARDTHLGENVSAEPRQQGTSVSCLVGVGWEHRAAPETQPTPTLVGIQDPRAHEGGRLTQHPGERPGQGPVGVRRGKDGCTVGPTERAGLHPGEELGEGPVAPRRGKDVAPTDPQLEGPISRRPGPGKRIGEGPERKRRGEDVWLIGPKTATQLWTAAPSKKPADGLARACGRQVSHRGTKESGASQEEGRREEEFPPLPTRAPRHAAKRESGDATANVAVQSKPERRSIGDAQSEGKGVQPVAAPTPQPTTTPKEDARTPDTKTRGTHPGTQNTRPQPSVEERKPTPETERRLAPGGFHPGRAEYTRRRSEGHHHFRATWIAMVPPKADQKKSEAPPTEAKATTKRSLPKYGYFAPLSEEESSDSSTEEDLPQASGVHAPVGKEARAKRRHREERTGGQKRARLHLLEARAVAREARVAEEKERRAEANARRHEAQLARRNDKRKRDAESAEKKRTARDKEHWDPEGWAKPVLARMVQSTLERLSPDPPQAEGTSQGRPIPEGAAESAAPIKDGTRESEGEQEEDENSGAMRKQRRTNRNRAIAMLRSTRPARFVKEAAFAAKTWEEGKGAWPDETGYTFAGNIASSTAKTLTKAGNLATAIEEVRTAFEELVDESNRMALTKERKPGRRKMEGFCQELKGFKRLLRDTRFVTGDIAINTLAEWMILARQIIQPLTQRRVPRGYTRRPNETWETRWEEALARPRREAWEKGVEALTYAIGSIVKFWLQSELEQGPVDKVRTLRQKIQKDAEVLIKPGSEWTDAATVAQIANVLTLLRRAKSAMSTAIGRQGELDPFDSDDDGLTVSVRRVLEDKRPQGFEEAESSHAEDYRVALNTGALGKWMKLEATKEGYFKVRTLALASMSKNWAAHLTADRDPRGTKASTRVRKLTLDALAPTIEAKRYNVSGIPRAVRVEVRGDDVIYHNAEAWADVENMFLGLAQTLDTLERQWYPETRRLQKWYVRWREAAGKLIEDLKALGDALGDKEAHRDDWIPGIAAWVEVATIRLTRTLGSRQPPGRHRNIRSVHSRSIHPTIRGATGEEEMRDAHLEATEIAIEMGRWMREAWTDLGETSTTMSRSMRDTEILEAGKMAGLGPEPGYYIRTSPLARAWKDIIQWWPTVITSLLAAEHKKAQRERVRKRRARSSVEEPPPRRTTQLRGRNLSRSGTPLY